MILTTCPACGQPLPEEQVEAARQKANIQQAEALEALLEGGKALRVKYDSLAEKIARKESEASALSISIADLIAQRDEAQAAVVDSSLNFDEDPEYLATRRKIRETSAEIADASAVADTSEIDAQISEVETQLQETARLEAEQRAQDGIRASIDELAAEEKKIGAEAEKVEKELHLCELFLKTKCEMLTDRINAKFERVSWVLFEPFVTHDGLKETCECRYLGTPGSSGERINAGLEICQVFGDAWGFTPPIILDGAESVTEPLATTAQLIQLRVLKGQKTLKVEKI